ncbi:MAG TPA: hypothetical protein VIZ68_04495 [Thermoplasmata archaeon]
MLACPFCGSPETDRIDLEGRRFLVFRCLFSPEVDPTATDEDVDRQIREKYSGPGGAYFRGMCDRLHLYVVKGEGAKILGAPTDGA